MCGISGIFTNKLDRDFTQTIKTISHSISHRGPDLTDFYIDRHRGVYLGHNRLKIIDLTANANQPMSNEDNTIYIVFNGEIYNHLELRKNLETRGYKYKSTSDTESILHGYEEYGLRIFEQMDGMFRLAIWDSRNNKLILARDRLGKKPMYYVHNSSGIYFASEAKAFINVEIPEWHKELDMENLGILLGFQYLPDSVNTIIKGLQKLESGHLIEVTHSSLEIKQYWTLAKKKSNVSYPEALEHTHMLLKSAVHKRILNCDVPQGILLSGGLDSSTIAAMAAQLSSTRIKTFTAVSNNKMDERSYAKVVADSINSEHYQVDMDYTNIIDTIDTIVQTYDDLNSFDPGIISTRLLAQQVRNAGITVVLMGEGADEVFGGYSWYGLSKLPFNLTPSFLRSSLYYYILSRVLYSGFVHKHRKLFHEKLTSYKGDIFDQISYYEVMTQLPNHFNMKVDKGTMSFGVEARQPYLDYRLVEYIFNLPTSYKLAGPHFNYKKSWEKRILRDISKQYLPENIYKRKKHGFMLSMIDVLNSNRDYITHRIDKNKQVILQVMPRSYYEALFNVSSNSLIAKEREFMTWRLFIFSVWYDYFFGATK